MARDSRTDMDRRATEYAGDTAYEYYTEGNTARQEVPLEVPERSRELRRRDDREAQRRSRQIRRNQDRALQMSPVFVMYIGVMSILLMLISVQYIRVQADISTAISDIEDAELTLEELKSGNDLLESAINTYADLDYIYQIATQELGMVYPDSTQVIYYESPESEYVRQYESIP